MSYFGGQDIDENKSAIILGLIFYVALIIIAVIDKLNK